MNIQKNHRFPYAKLALAIGLFSSSLSFASSHREAPFVTEEPRIDSSDFYMFNSYEEGREGFVTFVANYQPLQDAFAGPNYFNMDEFAKYSIHIDNNGDAVEDLTYQFDFDINLQDLAIDVGGELVTVPLIQIGEVGPTAEDLDNLNVIETFGIQAIQGAANDQNNIDNAEDINLAGDANIIDFARPVDNIGTKTIPDYEAFADDHIFDIDIPNCDQPGRVFVGQRKDSFVASLGKIFDLLNFDIIGEPDAEQDFFQNKNVTTIALEIAAECLVDEDETIIGAWTTASIPENRLVDQEGGVVKDGELVQASRLGMPLVNEVVIGLPDKDRFNASLPIDDGQFLQFVTNPTLPEFIEILFDLPAPDLFPRDDLVEVFLTGVADLNQPEDVVPSEMLRLNTAIPPVGAADQDPLGVLGGDNAGFPNGRRPGDDVVDISLRVVMGVLLDEADAPAGQEAFTDGAFIDANLFDEEFPYLVTPIAGDDDSAFVAQNDVDVDEEDEDEKEDKKDNEKNDDRDDEDDKNNNNDEDEQDDNEVKDDQIEDLENIIDRLRDALRSVAESFRS